MGERTIKRRRDDVDVDILLFIVHFVLLGGRSQKRCFIRSYLIPLIIRFLKNSHSYFLDFRLPEIRQNMLDAISDAPYIFSLWYKSTLMIIKRRYISIWKHENEVVFPYAEALLRERKIASILLEDLRSVTTRELKMLELKNIFIKDIY